MRGVFTVMNRVFWWIIVALVLAGIVSVAIRYLSPYNPVTGELMNGPRTTTTAAK
ncbi:MAG: hypothetical protein Q8Q36_02545 [bacterium]|nr:hypothetical protein [bacterium]